MNRQDGVWSFNKAKAWLTGTAKAWSHPTNEMLPAVAAECHGFLPFPLSQWNVVCHRAALSSLSWRGAVVCTVWASCIYISCWSALTWVTEGKNLKTVIAHAHACSTVSLQLCFLLYRENVCWDLSEPPSVALTLSKRVTGEQLQTFTPSLYSRIIVCGKAAPDNFPRSGPPHY